MPVLSAHRFCGMDVRTDPGDLHLTSPGKTPQALNVYARGGNYYSRPGIKALLSQKHLYPVYVGLATVDENGDEWVIYATGPSSGGGQLFKVAKSGGVPIAITDASNGSIVFSINAPAFRAVQAGTYAYFVWGGPSIYRMNLTETTASALTALQPPTGAPTASLSSSSTLSSFDPSTATCDQPPQYAPGIAQAQATATLGSGGTAGQIASINLVSSNTGGNYGANASAPSVIISDPTGAGATATATVNASGVITGFTVTNPGSGYTAPTISIIPTSNAPANAFADSWKSPDGSHTWANNSSNLGWTSTNLTMYGASGGGGSLTGTMESVGAPALYDLDANDNTTKLQWACFNASNSTLSTASSSAQAIQNIQHTDGSGDWAWQLLVSFQYWQGNKNAGVTVGVTPCSDNKGTTPVAATQYFTFQPKNPTGSVLAPPACSAVFSFPQLAGSNTPAKSWVVEFQGAPSIVPPGGTLSKGLFIGYITGGPVWANITLQSKGAYPNGKWQTTQLPQQVTSGGWTSDGLPDAVMTSPQVTAFTEDARLTTTFGANQNLSNYSTVTVPLEGFLAANGTSAFPSLTGMLELRLLPSGAIAGQDTGYQSVPLTIDTSGAFAYGDLSEIPATDLQSVSAMQLHFLSNPVATLGVLQFNIGGLTATGNLPVGTLNNNFAPISYAFEELYSGGDFTLADPIESAGSNISNELTPTNSQATATGSIPEPVNTQTDYVRVFRSGGTFEDGLFRCIGSFPLAYSLGAPLTLSDLSIPAGHDTYLSSATRTAASGDVGQTILIPAPTESAPQTGFTPGLYQVTGISGSDWIMNAVVGTAGSTAGAGTFGGDNLACDNANPNVTWDHTTRTFTDNTPDSYLNSNVLILQINRDLPPAGATDIAVWQNRIAVCSDEGVWLSWSLIDDAQNGIYFSATSDFSTDPYYTTKGFEDDISPGDNDPITCLLSIDSQLLALKGRSAGLLMGYDPSNFALQSYLTAAGNGCIALRGKAVYNNEALYRGIDQIYQFDGDTVERRALEIGPLLFPDGNDGGPTISEDAAKQTAMFVYNAQLHVLAPLAGDTENTVDFVYDFIEQAWTQWKYPVGMTSGCTLTASSDGDAAFLGGYDGQLYSFAPGQADTTTKGTSPICGSVTSRGLGEELTQYNPSAEVGIMGLLDKDATEYYASVSVPNTDTTLTCFAYADGDSSPGSDTYWSEPYTPEKAGRIKIRKNLPPNVAGTQVFAGVGFEVSSGQVMVRFLALDVQQAAPTL